MSGNPSIVRAIVCLVACIFCASCSATGDDQKSKSKSTNDESYSVLPIVDEDIMPRFKLAEGEMPPETEKEYIDVVDRTLDAGAYNDALSYSRKGVKAHPKSGRLHYLLGKAMLSTVDCDEREAIQNLEKAQALGYQTTRLFELIATTYADHKEFGKAIKALSRAIKMNPRDRVVYKYRAAMYLENGDIKNAEKDYGKFIEVSKRSGKTTAAYISRGQFYEGQKQYKKALNDYTKAYQSGENTHAILKKRVNVYLKLGDREHAIPDLNEIISINPKDDDAMRMRADLFREQKKYQKALADYTRAIEVSPEYAMKAYEGRALVYDTMNKPELAARDRKRAKTLYDKPAEKTLFKMK